MKTATALACLVGAATAEILWDGRFNNVTSSAALAEWSWSNQVGPYQYYIHGDGKVTDYVNLSPDYGNPADKGSSKGAKISLTKTSYWEGQTMRRTELIPQTNAKIAAGKVFYHFSIKHTTENPPSTAREHQIAFFESHFTELQSGLAEGASGTSNKNLQWMVGGTSKWEVTWEAGVWHNMAYEIDFSGKTVGLWHSTGGDALKRVVAPVSASTSSNGADWHVGALELGNGDADTTEDFYFSGVYIQDGDMVTSVSSPGGSGTTGSGTSGTGSSDAISSGSASPETATSHAKVATPQTTTAAQVAPAKTTTAEVAAAKTTNAAKVSTVKTTLKTVATPTLAAVATTAPEATSAATAVSLAPTSAAAPAAETSAAPAPAATSKSSRCKAKRRARRVIAQ